MRFSLICGIALLAIVGPMYVESFKMPDMESLKEGLNKLMEAGMKHLHGIKDPESLSKDVTKTLHEKMEAVSGMKIKDPKALEEAIKHLMYLHADKTLTVHKTLMATSDKMFDVIKKTVKSEGKILPSVDEKKIREDLTTYQRNSVEEIRKTFSKLIADHGVKFEHEKMNEIMKQFFASFKDGKWQTIMETFTKHYAKPMDKTVEDKMRSSMIAKATEIKNKLMNNMKTILKAHGISFPAETVEKSLSEMNMNMLEHYFEKREPVEKKLKEYYNQVMDLMIKAYGNKDNADLIKMLQKVQTILPPIMEAKIREFMAHSKKSGKKMCLNDFLEKLVLRLQPPQVHEETDDDDRRRHHHHHHRHRKMYIKIFVPIVGLLILIAIAVGVFCCLKKRKQRNAEEFDDIKKLPSKKTNPYDHLDETHSVSKA